MIHGVAGVEYFKKLGLEDANGVRVTNSNLSIHDIVVLVPQLESGNFFICLYNK